MKYLVTEIQTWDTGSIQNPTYAYDDRLSAEAKYHSILATAAKSTLPMHACIMMTSDGREIMHQCYTHPLPEPEPTPELEEPTE